MRVLSSMEKNLQQRQGISRYLHSIALYGVSAPWSVMEPHTKTACYHVQAQHKSQILADIERCGCCFSEGIGQISQELLSDVLKNVPFAQGSSAIQVHSGGFLIYYLLPISILCHSHLIYYQHQGWIHHIDHNQCLLR